MDVRFLGHACFELSDGDARVLIDPFLAPYNPVAIRTAGDLSPQHVVVTHGHMDHVASAVEVCKNSDATVYALVELAGWFSKQEITAVDINLGCPAKKVVKCGGSGLLRDMPLLEQIFRAVRAAVKIPLTIKLRAGWDENSIVAVDVAKLAESVGVEAIAVHPRTRMQGYAGQADWNLIAQVKQAVRIPVIGNGDINIPEDAERMVAETGCDAVMIGRAAATNP